MKKDDLFAPPDSTDLKKRGRQRLDECKKAGTHHQIGVRDIAVGLEYYACSTCGATWGHAPLPKDYNPEKDTRPL